MCPEFAGHRVEAQVDMYFHLLFFKIPLLLVTSQYFVKFHVTDLSRIEAPDGNPTLHARVALGSDECEGKYLRNSSFTILCNEVKSIPFCDIAKDSSHRSSICGVACWICSMSSSEKTYGFIILNISRRLMQSSWPFPNGISKPNKAMDTFTSTEM